MKTAAYASGVAVFVHLAAEELMTEGHEKADAPRMTVLFFAGFAGLVALDGALPTGRETIRSIVASRRGDGNNSPPAVLK